MAATLSALWPGLGQWYAGRPRAAVLYAVPVVLFAILLGQQLLDGLTVFAVRLLDPAFSLTLVILIVLAAAWRLLSIIDAAVGGQPGHHLRRSRLGLVAVIAVAVVGVHALAASYAYSFYTAGSRSSSPTTRRRTRCRMRPARRRPTTTTSRRSRRRSPGTPGSPSS